MAIGFFTPFFSSVLYFHPYWKNISGVTFFFSCYQLTFFFGKICRGLFQFKLPRSQRRVSFTSGDQCHWPRTLREQVPWRVGLFSETAVGPETGCARVVIWSWLCKGILIYCKEMWVGEMRPVLDVFISWSKWTTKFHCDVRFRSPYVHWFYTFCFTAS